jgi:hypothetical protein
MMTQAVRITLAFISCPAEISEKVEELVEAFTKISRLYFFVVVTLTTNRTCQFQLRKHCMIADRHACEAQVGGTSRQNWELEINAVYAEMAS